jgi:predicted DsbA family dithiol-disulfide isomerase
VVDRLSEEYGERLEFSWNAFELRPEPVPLPDALDPVRRQRWARSVLPMAAERGLVMAIPPIATRTRLAFQAAELARDQGKFGAMHRAIFEAFFRDGRNIGDKEVLAEIGASVGLAPGLLRQTLESGTHLERVLDQQRLSRELGVTGVPAAFVGDDPAAAEPVIGAVPYDWFKAAVERGLSGESLDWRRRALRSGIPLKDSHD